MKLVYVAHMSCRGCCGKNNYLVTLFDLKNVKTAFR